jgi:riboflavin synthase
MFTGIIISKGVIKEIKEKEEGVVIYLEVGDLVEKVKKGSSVSVGGICLTVVDINDQVLGFDVMPETLKKTVLGQKKIGDKVNLELTLRVGDEVGGHFVYGHVDGVGEVVSVENQGDNRLVTIKPPEELMKYLSPQGSMAIDGTSLTVASFDESTFTISLIPFTLEETTLGDLKVGDKVNLEADMLLKHNYRINSNN